MPPLLLRALAAEETDRRPLWLMRQAGRMLPEYRRLRERYSFEQLCAIPELAAQVTLLPLERFAFDAAIVFADLMTPVAALGIEVSFAPGPVVREPLDSAAAIRALPRHDPAAIAPNLDETLRLASAELSGRTPLLGFAGGPWSIAAYLVQGQGAREFPRLRALAFEDPGALEELLARLADLCGDYLARQVEAGADAVQVFETWSGILGRADWERLVKPHLTRLLERVGETGAPRILFLKDAPHLIDACVDLPVEALSTDWRVDLPMLRQRLGSDRPLQGNLDPAILLAGPRATRRSALELMRRMPRRGHVMNLGHGASPDTPLASVQALIDVVHEEASGWEAGPS